MATSIDTTVSFVTDLNDVRRYLKIPVDHHEEDGVLIAMVNHCATLFERYTQRNLKQRAYTGQLNDANGGTTMNLKEWPVDRTATFTVNEDVNRVFTSADLTLWNDSGDPTSADFMLDDEIGELEMIHGRSWPVGKKTVKVTYTAGIATADAGHIIHAMMVQISMWWNERGKELLRSFNTAGFGESLDKLHLHRSVRAVLVGESRQEF